jgi:hypothetical protein
MTPQQAITQIRQMLSHGDGGKQNMTMFERQIKEVIDKIEFDEGTTIHTCYECDYPLMYVTGWSYNHGGPSTDTWCPKCGTHHGISMSAVHLSKANPAPASFDRHVVTLKDRFTNLADLWEKGTVGLEDVKERYEHKAYLELTRFGANIVPFIFERMRTKPGWWFKLLYQITGASPVPKEHDINILEMTRYWQAWSQQEDVKSTDILLRKDMKERGVTGGLV